MTTLLVLATGNHWWLDGIIAAALLIAIRLGARGAAALAEPLRGHGGPELAPGVALAAGDTAEGPGG